jgi:hypothetical protein
VIISGRGYSDRTAFGMLIAGRELLSRSYPQHRRLGCVALSDRPCRRDTAYLAAGIPIEYLEGVEPWPETRRGPFPTRPRPVPSGQDALLDRYYRELCGARGTFWQEVPVGDAALDGLYVTTRPGTFEWWPGKHVDLASTVRDFDVEVVEAKAAVNADVIGQAVAGASLLMHDYPQHRVVSQAVVVGGEPDKALDWVCHKRGIQLARFC